MTARGFPTSNHRPSHLQTRPAALRALFCLAALLGFALPGGAQSVASGPVYTFHTNLGDVAVELYPTVAPQTVANFVRYINAGRYNNVFFHHSVPDFVVQTGGYIFDGVNTMTVAEYPPVVNEFRLTNARGTIAMAKLDSDPNSATSQWFVNLADNSANLDNQNGGFTVFGRIADSASMAVVDRIASLPTTNAGSPFDQLPVYNYTPGATITVANLVVTSGITGASLLAVSPQDGGARLLAAKGNGLFPLRSVTSAGAISAQKTYGPLSGYTLGDVAVGPNGKTVILWRNTAQQKAAFWIVSADLATVETTFSKAYPAGWTPAHLAIDPLNKIRISWEKNGTAQIALWTMEPTSAATITNSYAYNPFPATLRHAGIAVGGDNRVRVLWNEPTRKQAIIWTLPAPYGPPTSGAVFATPASYFLSGFAVGTDNKAFLLWRRTDNAVAVWRTNGNTIEAGKIYGPIPKVSPLAIGVAPDNTARLYWGYTDGRTALWKLSANLSVAAGYTFDAP